MLAILGQLTKSGIPTEKHILKVERPFPVAGLAYWVDDWHAYRCCPKPHLHQGLDLMAPLGTPLVAVADGVVTRKINDPVWTGLGVSLTDHVSTRYSYAHLSAFASGLQVGQKVRMGDIIGYVGNTGDAAGGPYHLHFEVHPYGGGAVPPKPEVDEWLDAAEHRAWKLVRKLTGKNLTDADLDLSLWKGRLYELAQDEIQAANVLAARQTSKVTKVAPRADQLWLGYGLPVVLLALLAGALLFIDSHGKRIVSLRKRRRGDPKAEAITILDSFDLSIEPEAEPVEASAEPAPPGDQRLREPART
jgi:hypothetical protein